MSQIRRLAAILAADMASYSRLIGADEGGTLRQLRAIGPQDDLPDDRSTIIHLPGRTGKVSAHLATLLIKEVRLRHLE